MGTLKDVYYNQSTRSEKIASILQITPHIGLTCFLFYGLTLLFAPPTPANNHSLKQLCSQFYDGQQYNYNEIRTQLSRQSNRSLSLKYDLYCDDIQLNSILALILIVPTLFRVFLFLIDINPVYRLRTIGLIGIIQSVFALLSILVDGVQLFNTNASLTLIIMCITVQFVGLNLIVQLYFISIYLVFDKQYANLIIVPISNAVFQIMPFMFLVLSYFTDGNWKLIQTLFAVVSLLSSVYISFINIKPNPKSLYVDQQSNQLLINQQSVDSIQPQQQDSWMFKSNIKQIKQNFRQLNGWSALCLFIMCGYFYTIMEGYYLGIKLELPYLSYSLELNGILIAMSYTLASIVSPFLLIYSNYSTQMVVYKYMAGFLMIVYFMAPLSFNQDGDYRLVFMVILMLGLFLIQITSNMFFQFVDHNMNNQLCQFFYGFFFIIQCLFDSLFPYFNYVLRSNGISPIAGYGSFIVSSAIVFHIWIHINNRKQK